MSHLNRGDFFQLDHCDGKSYIGFVRSGRDLVTLVLLDPVSDTLKTVTGFSAGSNNFTKLAKSGMPAILKKAYDECFVSIKKGSKVSFKFEGSEYSGVVVRGGANPKVELFINGDKFYTSGPAIMYTVIEE